MGAITHTSTATASRAIVLSSAPSSSGSRSLDLMSSAVTHTALKTMKLTQARAIQPKAGQKWVARNPKCHGRGRRVMRANSSADPTSAASWKAVARISTLGGGWSSEAPPAAATAPIRIAPKTATTKAAIRATGAVQGGQCGCGDRPSGSSGSSGGGPGCGKATGGGGGGRLLIPNPIYGP